MNGSYVNDNFQEDDDVRQRKGNSAMPGVSEAGISTVVDKDSIARKHEQDDGFVPNKIH